MLTNISSKSLIVMSSALTQELISTMDANSSSLTTLSTKNKAKKMHLSSVRWLTCATPSSKEDKIAMSLFMARQTQAKHSRFWERITKSVTSSLLRFSKHRKLLKWKIGLDQVWLKSTITLLDRDKEEYLQPRNRWRGLKVRAASNPKIISKKST